MGWLRVKSTGQNSWILSPGVTPQITNSQARAFCFTTFTCIKHPEKVLGAAHRGREPCTWHPPSTCPVTGTPHPAPEPAQTPASPWGLSFFPFPFPGGSSCAVTAVFVSRGRKGWCPHPHQGGTSAQGSEHQPEQGGDNLGPFYSCQDKAKGKAGWCCVLEHHEFSIWSPIWTPTEWLSAASYTPAPSCPGSSASHSPPELLQCLFVCKDLSFHGSQKSLR